jgi:hypothetical protein
MKPYLFPMHRLCDCEDLDTFRTRQLVAAETSKGISVRDAFLAEQIPLHTCRCAECMDLYCT